MKKPTISDVANEADVSKSTVSRIINNAPNVDAELRERVLEVIERLDYQPSRAARILKKNLQDVIGFLVPSITNTIFGDVLQGAEDQAYNNKMGIVAYSTADSLQRQQMYLDALLAEQLAGLVIVPVPGTDPKMLSSMQNQGIPIVLLDRKLKDLDADYIGSDNQQGASVAVHHLVENGYRRIATIAGSQNVSTGIERLNGYRQALAEANLDYNPDWVVSGNFSEEESYRALKSLVEQDNRPDAIFVANDSMMVGALHAIKDLNIRVPDDFAIIGFDELPLADLLSPSLTTVQQVADALGQEALRLLFDRMQHPNRPSRVVQMSTRINIRESTRRKSDNS